MPLVAIINLSLASAIFSLLIMGLVLNFKYTQSSVYKRYLMFTMSFWLVMLLSVYVKFCVVWTGDVVYNRDLISARLLILGIPSFLSIISMPIVVLNANLLKVRNWIKVVSPMAIAVVIYFVWHYATGNDPFTKYGSYEELRLNLGSVSFILRAALYLIFLAYIVLFLVCIRRVVPLYNQYIQENISDSRYNVDWLKTFLWFIWTITIAYFAMTLTNSRYVNGVYLITLLVTFGYLIEESLFHKTVEGVESLTVRWSAKIGWHVEGVHTENIVYERGERLRLERAWIEINEWMVSDAPYTNAEFSIQDMVDHFNDLTNGDITAIFKLNGESFQTFVRGYRITRACEIINNHDGEISFKQLFLQVGFSHYSSFSRAFTIVNGMSPSDYVNSQRAMQAELQKQNLKNPPPPRRSVTH